MPDKNILAGFRAPDKSCSQIPFWFLNGPVDGKEWARQIGEMAARGVYQAMPHPRYGMDKRDYLTDKYWKAFSRLVHKAAKTGFTLHLYDEFNWSSGPAGGRVTARRENCALALGMREQTAQGPARLVFDEWTEGLHGMAVPERYTGLAIVPAGEKNEINIKKCRWLPIPRGPVSRLAVKIPAGKWRVMVFYMLRTIPPSPLRMGVGGIINYLSGTATDLFIKVTHEQYAARYSKYFGKVIPSIFYDEVGPYAGGPFSWVEDFPAQFKARKGYDILPLLPLLFHDGGAKSEKLRCDYWDTVAGLFVERFIGKIASWCGKRGIALTGHGYETANAFMLSADLYRSLRAQQWVGFDSLGEAQPFSTLKLPVSVAHARGEKTVICESLGCMGGWGAAPRMARRGYNRLAVAGVTHFVPHGFFQTVNSPKVECPPSFFEDTTYWKYYRQVAELTSRLSLVNRLGVHVADAAVFYPIVSWWGDSPGGRGYAWPWQVAGWDKCRARPDCEAFDAIINLLVENHVDLDVIDGTALAGSSVYNRRLGVADELFQALILPPMRTARLADIGALLKFAESGGTVIVVGRFPSVSMEHGRHDRKLADMISRLRRLALYAKTPEALPGLVRKVIKPDVSVIKGDPGQINISHRRTGEEDFYFLSNTSTGSHHVRLGLRAGGFASLWDPATGSAYKLESVSKGEITEADVRLEPGEGSFLVISKKKAAAQPLPPWRKSEPKRALSLEGAWKFIPVQRALDKKWSCNAGDRQELAVHVFKTATDTARPASGPSSKDGKVIDSGRWFKDDFEDSDWDTVHCLRQPLIYNDFGSRHFRACIPDCADAVKLPLPIEKEYALYAGGKLLRVVRGRAKPEHGWLKIPGHGKKGRTLAIECASMAPDFGLKGPIIFRCKYTETELRSWTEMGLWWYSGRCIYRKNFTLAERDLRAKNICLDLGDVRECAEVWINGKLAGTRIWPPYRVEITGLLKKGRNELAVVVSNLPSNRYAWDVWGSRGRGETLVSGLLGPAFIEFY